MRKLFPAVFSLEFCLLLIVPASPTLHAEAAFGVSGLIDFELMIDPGDPVDSDLNQVNTLTPRLSIWSDIYEFSGAGSVDFESFSGALDFTLKEFKLVINPLDFMSLKLGYFNYLPGTAQFLSTTNFFSRIDYERLLAGTVEESIVPTTIVQTGFFFLDFYLLLTVSPFRADMILPATDSPWFYGKDIPESIIEPLFGQEIFLEELYYSEEDQPPYDFSQISYSPELGGTLWGVDFSLLYYYGYDNSPLVQAYFRQMGVTDPYDIELVPVYRKIHALGLNLATNFSALRLWADAAYTFSKSFLANKVGYGRNTPVVESPHISYALGSSYEFAFPDLLMLAEVKNSHIIDDNETIIDPVLSSAIITAAQLSLFDYRLATHASLIYSPADPSVAAVCKLSFTPFADFAVQLLAPFFFGPSDTELGQYSGNYFVSVEVVWGY
jgi:hypothetical protein